MYKEFVESFEDADRGLKRAWVKGGVVNPEKGTKMPGLLVALLD